MTDDMENTIPKPITPEKKVLVQVEVPQTLVNLMDKLRGAGTEGEVTRRAVVLWGIQEWVRQVKGQKK